MNDARRGEQRQGDQAKLSEHVEIQKGMSPQSSLPLRLRTLWRTPGFERCRAFLPNIASAFLAGTRDARKRSSQVVSGRNSPLWEREVCPATDCAERCRADQGKCVASSAKIDVRKRP